MKCEGAPRAPLETIPEVQKPATLLDSTRRAFVRLGALALVGATCAKNDPISSSARPAKPAMIPRATSRRPGAMQQGFCFAHSMRDSLGYGSAASMESLKRLQALGATAVSLTPFAFQRLPDERELRWFHSGAGGLGETDDRVIGAARQAKQLGLEVMMKPHVWLRRPHWPGSIEHTTDEGWKQWFSSYSDFILHYASMAKREGMQRLCIGNELDRTAHRGEWLDVIAKIREQYDGKITYGANFDRVFDHSFWKYVDEIGVSAYFPLVNSPRPSVDELMAAWLPIRQQLRALSEKYERPIVFTEIGYRSAERGAWRQWEITRESASSPETQVHAYEAFFQTFWNEPWFSGSYVWKWESYPAHAAVDDGDYHVDAKPALAVIEKYYRKQEAGG